MDSGEYKICEKEVLSEYSSVKEELTNSADIICQHIGTFTQEILVSFVSILEHQATQIGEVTLIEKRLVYLVIECIQNIIYHSYKLPNDNQLAYIIVSKNKEGYSISTSNFVESKNINDLVDRIDSIMKVDKDMLPKIFMNKIKKQQIHENGHGGMGLLTIISKSGKNFKYKISKLTSNYSLFHIEINLSYKIKFNGKN